MQRVYIYELDASGRRTGRPPLIAQAGSQVHRIAQHAVVRPPAPPPVRLVGALAEPEPEPTPWYTLCVYPATLLASHDCDSSAESEITPVV